jgi:hypothetical protein
VKEFVEATAGFPCPEVVRQGIIDHPYLRSIYVKLVNANNEQVAEVTLLVDWAKHRILASGAGTDAFDFDSTRSISEQISKALLQLKTFVAAVRMSGQFRAEVWYGVRSDAGVSYEEACRALGLTAGSKQLEWAKGKYLHATFRAIRLEELHVDVRTIVG